MSLYLCIFKAEEEVDGLEVGSYSDFGYFRDIVIDKLEAGQAGSRFPTLIRHSDCDGAWSVEEARQLQAELEEIALAFRNLPPEGAHAEWQRHLAKTLGLRFETLYDGFIDVDGEPLLERLIGLCKLSQKLGEPILFQ